LLIADPKILNKRLPVSNEGVVIEDPNFFEVEILSGHCLERGKVEEEAWH
jgi:hypothetical protein